MYKIKQIIAMILSIVMLTTVGGSNVIVANAQTPGGNNNSSGVVFDLSYGDIVFTESDKMLNITYVAEDGGETSITGQSYQDEYEIVQSANTAVTNQIIFKNTTDFVRVNLNGVDMISEGEAIDLQDSKVKLNINGKNTIDCGGGQGSYHIGIRVATGSELTIDGSGSLEIKNPSLYGVGVGGFFQDSPRIKEGAGIITIEGADLSVSGRYGAAIGSSYHYSGEDSGSIYIKGASCIIKK